MSLKVTEVTVNKINLEPNIVGFAKVTLNSSFVVDGIKIINGKNGIFVGMPSRKNKKGEYQDVCFPITKEARTHIQDSIINEYNKQGGSTANTSNTGDDDLPF